MKNNHYQFIISVDPEVKSRDMAIVDTVCKLKDRVPDADVFDITTYDEEINDGVPTGVAIDIGSDEDYTAQTPEEYDEMLEQLGDPVETVETLAVTPIDD